MIHPTHKTWLIDYTGKIKKWSHGGHPLWIFFNNDGHTHAIRNAKLLIQLMREAR